MMWQTAPFIDDSLAFPNNVDSNAAATTALRCCDSQPPSASTPTHVRMIAHHGHRQLTTNTAAPSRAMANRYKYVSGAAHRVPRRAIW